MSHDRGLLEWVVPAPPRPRRNQHLAVDIVVVAVIVLAHVAFAVEFHNVIATPVSCDVYCSTTPAIEVPALLAWPLLDCLSVMLGIVLLGRRGPSSALSWVSLLTIPVQVAFACAWSAVASLAGVRFGA